VAAERRAVLFDWGGVMTGDLFGSFRAFCSAEGLDPDGLANLFRHDRDARTLLIDFECGRLEEVDFEPRLAAALGLAWHEGLIDRLFAGAVLDEAMVAGVRDCARTGCVRGWSRTRGGRGAIRGTWCASCSTAW
jgi:putative hydrolase of the HAD superfamily